MQAPRLPAEGREPSSTQHTAPTDTRLRLLAHVCSAPHSPFYSGAAHQTSASPLAGARPHRTYSLTESMCTAAIPTAQPQRGRPAAPQGARLWGAAPPLRCCSCRAGEQDAAVPLRESETENSIPRVSGHANLA